MSAKRAVHGLRNSLASFNARGSVDAHLWTTTGKRGLQDSPAACARHDHRYELGLPGPTGTDQAQGGAGLALWWAPIDISASALRGLVACLSSEERRRANRFRRQHDRGRFIAARGWLRHLLASELRCAPSDITILTGDGGKPRLASSDLSFNASHTASIALYATSRSMEVGVDIEAIRATTDIDRMAARFLSQAEQRRLGLLSPAQREPAFFQCWTRKEALLKGVGAGLRFPLREVDVWDGDGRPATVSGWSVHDVDLAPGFAAAVAGASLDDWVPPVPRRLRALSPEIRTDYRQAVAPAAQVASGR